MNSQAKRNIIIATPNATFAEQLKKNFERVNFKVIEIVVVLEHLIEQIEMLKGEGERVDGILLSTDLGRKLEDRRLELLSDVLYTIRKQYDDMNIVILANEDQGHPLLAEFVDMGIYNLFLKGSDGLNIQRLMETFDKPMRFSDVAKFKEFNSSIPWRRLPSGPSSLIVNVNAAASDNEKTAPVTVEKVVEKEVVKVVQKEVVKVVEKVIEVDKVRDITTPSKLIVIGGMYPGAGSSFLTLTLARLLNYIGIPHAVVEHPSIQPELYSALYGDKHAPKGYRFLAEDILVHGGKGPREEWVEGHTTWYPLNQTGLPVGKSWTTDLTLKYLYQVKEPIVLLDVSHKWSELAVKDITVDADEIFFVVDAFLPSKYYRADSKVNEEALYELRQFGKSVNLVANKDIKVSKRSQWIKSLPFTPISIIPEIPYQEVISSFWDAKFFQDQPEHRSALLAATYSIMAKLVPPNYPIKHLKNGGIQGMSVFEKFIKTLRK
ncbi:hypothetical protein ACFPOG_12655 [Paenibacillus aestuarii]|uniref:Response regulator n=1 Tax=Paenibacillus aestuarii TaxID=516965 RepID=A0ABW0K6W4_9BACL